MPCVESCEMQVYSEPMQLAVGASSPQAQRLYGKRGRSRPAQKIVAAKMRRTKDPCNIQSQKREQKAFCPVCGSMLKGRQGCCVSCGTVIGDPAPETSRALQPILPIERLLFLHLDVESGRISYIESEGEHDMIREVELKEDKIE